MIYYLKIAGVGVKVVCPNNLYLFDEWKIFFEEKWGKSFLVKKSKTEITIRLSGLRVRGEKTIKESLPNGVIELPLVKKKTIQVDNLLNSAYLLVLLKSVIKDYLFTKGRVLMHASGVMVGDKAVLIMGKSGSGKTTALRSLMGKYRPMAEDDVVVEVDDHKLWCYPVLFSNKLNLGINNIRVEVGAVIFIRKNRPMRVTKIETMRAWKLLLDQIKGIINGADKAKLILKNIRFMTDKTYLVDCQRDDDWTNAIMEIEL